MNLADEITDLVRDYFDFPKVTLTPETDIAVVFGNHDPEEFGYFLRKVIKRYGITHRELRDMTPGAETRPRGAIHFLWDFFFLKTDMEVICVDHLTIAELSEIAKSRSWPERYIIPTSEWRRRAASPDT